MGAAHIRPYETAGGTHSPTNGILLRQDIHTLFDRGYITIAPDYRVAVSKRIKEEFNNDAEYCVRVIRMTTLFWNVPTKPSPTTSFITGNQRHFPKFWKKTKTITSRDIISLVAPHLIS